MSRNGCILSCWNISIAIKHSKYALNCIFFIVLTANITMPEESRVIQTTKTTDIVCT